MDVKKSNYWEGLGFRNKEEHEEFIKRTRQEMIDEAQKSNLSYNPDEDEWIIENLAILDDYEKQAFESEKCNIMKKNKL